MQVHGNSDRPFLSLAIQQTVSPLVSKPWDTASIAATILKERINSLRHDQIASSSLVYWVTNQRRVPIIGRWRLISEYLSDVSELEITKRSEKLIEESRNGASQSNSDPAEHDSFVRAIQSVLARLSAAAGIDKVRWDVEVLNAPTRAKVHVLSTSGRVVIDSGLWSILDTEDELAVILSHAISHEIANHLCEHSTKTIIYRKAGVSQLLFNIAAVFLARTGRPKVIVSTIILSTLVTVFVGGDALSLPDIWCQEANDIGTLMLAEAGYDLDAVDRVSTKLKTPAAAVPSTAVCRYDDENQIVLNNDRTAVYPQSIARHIRKMWGLSATDADSARKARWNEYLRTRRQNKLCNNDDGDDQGLER
ncbi:MAG: hypothetical protein Q9168_005784 [Polycauliona sp. 1 TL-2023]